MKNILFVASECVPFIKTGGLADVVGSLPKYFPKEYFDVRVVIPKYAGIKEQFRNQMQYVTNFYMDLNWRQQYVGIFEMEYEGIKFYFIDNEEHFGGSTPYAGMPWDLEKFAYFSKAALSILPTIGFRPDLIHCHDWQAALVPVYLRTLFQNTPLSRAKSMLTIHNLRFQGVYNIPTIRYWSGLPNYVFNKDALTQNWLDANMLKGGLTYCNMITTVSGTYAGEIQTPEYGEKLDAHLRYHSGKLRGIVNGIDYDIWNPWTDPMLHTNYDITNVLPRKKENKRALQEELGLWQDDHKFVIGLISRLTNQKGLDLVNAILPQIMDEHTQVVVLGTGDKGYEDAFRYYENAYRGNLCANIMYDEGRAHRIYAGADALLIPQIRTMDDIRRLKEYSQYPPIGRRGSGPSRLWDYGDSIIQLATDQDINRTTNIVVQLETVQAVEHIDEIVQSDFIDMFFIGPGDLSMDMGIFAQFSNPRLTDTIMLLREKTARAGKRLGIFAGNFDAARNWYAKGFDMCIINSELALLSSAVAGEVGKLRSELEAGK